MLGIATGILIGIVALWAIAHLWWYYKSGDCPYMSLGTRDGNSFVEWLWRNRHRIEPTGEKLTYVFTTPYQDGGWKFVVFDEFDCVRLYIAESLSALKSSRTRAMYTPYRLGATARSREYWHRLCEWQNDNEKYNNVGWKNPRVSE